MAHPVRRTWRSFCAISLFQNRTSEPKLKTWYMQTHGTRGTQLDGTVRTESPAVAPDSIRLRWIRRFRPFSPARPAPGRVPGARRPGGRSAAALAPASSASDRVLDDVTLCLVSVHSHLLGMLSLCNNQPRASCKSMAPRPESWPCRAEFSIKLYAMLYA